MLVMGQVVPGSCNSMVRDSGCCMHTCTVDRRFLKRRALGKTSMVNTINHARASTVILVIIFGTELQNAIAPSVSIPLKAKPFACGTIGRNHAVDILLLLNCTLLRRGTA